MNASAFGLYVQHQIVVIRNLGDLDFQAKLAVAKQKTGNSDRCLQPSAPDASCIFSRSLL